MVILRPNFSIPRIFFHSKNIASITIWTNSNTKFFCPLIPKLAIREICIDTFKFFLNFYAFDWPYRYHRFFKIRNFAQ